MFDQAMMLERYGYEDASEFPLWYLQMQGARMVRHLNNDLKQMAAMNVASIGATKSKKGNNAFKKLMERM